MVTLDAVSMAALASVADALTALTILIDGHLWFGFGVIAAIAFIQGVGSMKR